MTDKLKDKETMTAGVTPSKLEEGMTIDLHGHPVKVNSTDAEDTLVQYANLARRGFDTHALNGFLELGTFPVGTAFERPNERAVIEAVTGDCCYQVRITAGAEEPHHHTFTYADFIAWHMDNTTKITTSIIDDEDEHPFETDLQKRVEELTKENFALKQAISAQKQMHETIIAGYEEDIERLEKKAAIFAPSFSSKEIHTQISPLHMPEMRMAANTELAHLLSVGWSVLNFSVNSKIDDSGEEHYRITTLVRDLPAAPAPKVTVTDAAIYGPYTAVPRPAVQTPPMPAGQVIVNMGQPVSRPLTNNVSRTHGDTKRIPATYMQHEGDTEVFQDILNRNAAARAAILNQSSRPFGQSSQE